MTEWVWPVLEFLSEPLVEFGRPASHFYWLNLACFVVMTLAVYLYWEGRSEGFSLRRFASLYYGQWLHPSSILDLKFYVVDSLIFKLLFAPLVVGPLLIGAATWSALAWAFGEPPSPQAATGSATAWFTLVYFLAYDASRYYGHRAMHAIPVLWEFHKVHHSAEVLTPVTLYRGHPFDSFIMNSTTSIFVGLVSGLWIYASGMEFAMATVLKVNLGVFLSNLLFGNLYHSHSWFSFGPWLSHVFISPAQHQIHHSVEERHHDRNFGVVLALWDQIGRTLYVPTEREPLVYGLGEESKDYAGLVDLYVQPLRKAWGRLRGE